MLTKPQTGTIGVVGIFAWVIAWDLMAPQEITAVVRIWLRDPYKRWPTGAMIGLTALHLVGVCPRWADPWYQVGKLRPQVLKAGERWPMSPRANARRLHLPMPPVDLGGQREGRPLPQV